MSLLTTSIRTELLAHMLDRLNDGAVSDMDEINYHCFNEDYYVVYHNVAKKWLEEHGICPFDAIEAVVEWENDMLGEASSEINPETIVNKFVYIAGEELISELEIDDDTTVESLIAQLEEELEVTA